MRDKIKNLEEDNFEEFEKKVQNNHKALTNLPELYK